jgi:hypothetical protein
MSKPVPMTIPTDAAAANTHALTSRHSRPARDTWESRLPPAWGVCAIIPRLSANVARGSRATKPRPPLPGRWARRIDNGRNTMTFDQIRPAKFRDQSANVGEPCGRSCIRGNAERAVPMNLQLIWLSGLARPTLGDSRSARVLSQKCSEAIL